MTTKPSLYLTCKKSLLLLNTRDRLFLFTILLIQILVNFLDLIGVAFIGLLGALSVNGVQSREPGNRVSSLLKILRLSDNNFQRQVMFIGIIAAAILITRTLISIFLNKKLINFLSDKSAALSNLSSSKLLSSSVLFIQSKSISNLLFSLTGGIQIIFVGIIATALSVIGDLSLTLTLFVGLLILDTKMAILSTIFFGALGLILYWVLNIHAHNLGKRETEIDLEFGDSIVEAISSYREIVVRNRRHYYMRKISLLKNELAKIQARRAFMPNVSKYVMENSLVVGGLIIGAVQFLTQNAAHAIATISVYLAAGSRIAPAFLRIQQGLLSLKSNAGAADPSFDLINDLSDVVVFNDNIENRVSKNEFQPSINLNNLNYCYPDSEQLVLKGINLNVEFGSQVAIVGPSGSGKTTLIDLILGLLESEIGEISISDINPVNALYTWPGAFGYVPQDIRLRQGTIRDNITLGFDPETFTDEEIWEALEISQLKEFVENQALGFNTLVGENGYKLSGGQKQRLGIARAIITKPRLLILDEATSALDGNTESDISEAIKNLKGRVTVVLIAHRLSTIKHADSIIYLNEGQIEAVGTFEELRRKVKNFDIQAQK